MSNIKPTFIIKTGDLQLIVDNPDMITKATQVAARWSDAYCHGLYVDKADRNGVMEWTLIINSDVLGRHIAGSSMTIGLLRRGPGQSVESHS